MGGLLHDAGAFLTCRELPNSREFFLGDPNNDPLVFVHDPSCDGPASAARAAENQHEAAWTLKLTGFQGVKGSDLEHASISCDAVRTAGVTLRGALERAIQMWRPFTS